MKPSNVENFKKIEDLAKELTIALRKLSDRNEEKDQEETELPVKKTTTKKT